MSAAGLREPEDEIRVTEQHELFQVTTWTDRGFALADVRGEVDFYASRHLAEALKGVQTRAQRPGLIVLLAGLAFADSSALGVLVGALKRTRAVRGRLALVAVPEHFAKTLRITGMGPLMPGFDTLAAAFAWLEGEDPA